MMFKKPFFLALYLNIFFFLLYFVFGQVRHGSLDDYFMSSVLTGAYGGEYDVHMYFVNVAYGYFLKPFYWLFPKVGWYFIFELLGTFSAFTVYTYILIQKMGCRYGMPLALLLLASFAPDFYFQISFTQCAASYTAAGILLVYESLMKKSKRMLALAGVALLAGSVMRWEGFLLGMPYLCFLLLLVWYGKRNLEKKTIVALALIFVAIAGLHFYDKNLYVEGDYKYYAEYQPVRAFFGDGEFYDRESTYDELEERGLSGVDFYMLKAWDFYDTEVFSIDSLKPIVQVAQNNLYFPNVMRLPISFFLVVSKALTRCSGWCWAIFCLVLMLTMSKRANLYPWVSLVFIAASIGYLLLVNRLVYHVESGVWLYANVCGIAFMSWNNFPLNLVIRKCERIIPIVLFMLAGFFSYFAIAEQPKAKTKWYLIETSRPTIDWQSFLDYAHVHLDDVFILSFDRYKSLGTVHNPPYLAIEPGSWNNIFSLGYWNIYLPAMKAELKKRGVTNPMKDIVHDNVYLLEDNNQPSLSEFYERHYHERLSVDTVKTFGNLMLLKYRFANIPAENGDE